MVLNKEKGLSLACLENFIEIYDSSGKKNSQRY